MSHNAPEPMPIRTNDRSIWDMVIEDMHERNQIGTAKYGGPLVANDGRRSLVDAYQEALDLAVYLKKEIVEREVQRAELEKFLHAAMDKAWGGNGWASGVSGGQLRRRGSARGAGLTRWYVTASRIGPTRTITRAWSFGVRRVAPASNWTAVTDTGRRRSYAPHTGK